MSLSPSLSVYLCLSLSTTSLSLSLSPGITGLYLIMFLFFSESLLSLFPCLCPPVSAPPPPLFLSPCLCSSVSAPPSPPPVSAPPPLSVPSMLTGHVSGNNYKIIITSRSHVRAPSVCRCGTLPGINIKYGRHQRGLRSEVTAPGVWLPDQLVAASAK